MRGLLEHSKHPAHSKHSARSERSEHLALSQPVPRAVKAWFRRALSGFGSLRLTLAILVALGLGVTAGYLGRLPMTWLVAVPLTLLAANLCFALFTHAVFRQQPALTLFHVALIALLLLAALGRLTYLKARIEISEGQRFDGVPVEVEQGPWHPYRLDRIALTNERVLIDYSAATTIRGTTNDVRWLDSAGYWQQGVVRENEPLVLLGYRIYVTGGKGFAPQFAWFGSGSGSAVGAPASEIPAIGSVHLPRFPSDEHAQQAEWTLPDGKTAAWVTLRFDTPPLKGGQLEQLAAPGTAGHKVVLRLTDPTSGLELRHELHPGEAIDLPGGRLEYRGLKLWMGYLVHYDWTVPWLLAASSLATLALGAHFLAKFRLKEW